MQSDRPSEAARSAAADAAIDEGRRCGVRRKFGGVLHLGVHRREAARRIGRLGGACDREGLAPAAAKIDVSPLARGAGLLHPSGAAEAVKRVSFIPNLSESFAGYIL